MNVSNRSVWKTVRVFISSTFRDMQAERDHLVRFVFPKLRQELVERRIHLVDVDLRWGVTSDQDAFELCMDEIDRCHPRFICILGGRYGWVPPPGKLTKEFFNAVLSGTSPAGSLSTLESDALTKLYEFVQQKNCYFLRDKPQTILEVKGYFAQSEQVVRVLQRAGLPEANKSITAAEIHHGALDRLQKPAFRYFYFRDDQITNFIPEPAWGDYREPEGSIAAQLLNQLKTRIRDVNTLGKVMTAPGNESVLPLVWHNYSCRWDPTTSRITDLTKFGEMVYHDLLDSIMAEFGEIVTEDPDEFTEENAAMEALIGRCTERFVLGSRHAVKSKLLAHANTAGANGYLCLTGLPGSGKSAMLAKLCQEKSLTGTSSSLLIQHFVGASAGSTDIYRTLRRLCHELKKSCPDIKDDIPVDTGHLIIAFKNFLLKACVKNRVVIVIDAVNQFDPHTLGDKLSWLPAELPSNARIIFSAPVCPTEDELNGYFQLQEVKLALLDPTDAEAIIVQFLELYRKKLEPVQRIALLAKADAGLPLYLTTAMEELRTLGTYEEINQRIAELPPTTTELFAWILKRLETDDGFRDDSGNQVGHKLVPRFSALLGSCRYGLSQRELAELLDPNDPRGNVAALLQLLRPYLMHRGELLDFSHGQFRSAACSLWLSGPEDRAKANQTLAKYFQRTADPEMNGSWISLASADTEAIAGHALEEVSYHAYRYAMESGNTSLLFDLTNDEVLRNKLFEHSGSPRLPIELIDFSVEISALNSDLVHLVHFMMIRTGFVTFMARSYLVQLPRIVKYEGKGQAELARAITRLISKPDHRRIGLLLVAWLICFDPLRKPLVKELIVEATGIKAPVDACQSAILLEIIIRLCQEGYMEVIALVDSIPPSPIREKYQKLWRTGRSLVPELTEKLSQTDPVNPSISQTEIDELQKISEFVSAHEPEFSHAISQAAFDALETKMCEDFGMSGAAGGYFLMACDHFQAGKNRKAESNITRGIYICLASVQLLHRTGSAMVKAFARIGEKDMSYEEEARVRTHDMSADKESHSPEDHVELNDRRYELLISKDFQANTWEASGSQTVLQMFQAGVHGTFNQIKQSEAGKSEYANALCLISDARYVLARGLQSELPSYLSKVFDLMPCIPENLHSGLYIAIYCLARNCGHQPFLRKSAAELSKTGVNPESLFSDISYTESQTSQKEYSKLIRSLPADILQNRTNVVKNLSTAEPCCIAAVAMVLREAGQTQCLYDLLWNAIHLDFPMRKLDPLLCELIRLPDRNAYDLRKISDEILNTRGALLIPLGMGGFYYPGMMLVCAWVGGVLMAIGFTAARNLGSTLLAWIGIFIASGAIGALADLLIWKAIKIWERPEISRKLYTKSGTIAIFMAIFFVFYRLFPEQILKSQDYSIGVFAGILVLLLFLLRKKNYLQWDKKRLLSGTYIASLLGITGWWAARQWFDGPTALHLLTGLFIAGSFALIRAMNIFPKYLACVWHYGQRGNV